MEIANREARFLCHQCGEYKTSGVVSSGSTVCTDCEKPMQTNPQEVSCEDCGILITKGEEWVCWDETGPLKKAAICCKKCSDKRLDAL